MPYRIDLPPQARKALDRLDAKTFLRIDKDILALKDNPRPVGCKKLEDNVYRIRTGDWRILYAVFDDRQIVQIVRVARRSEKTYRGLP